MKEQRVCQKADRCFKGEDCPRNYIPDTEWYRCFDRRKRRACLGNCSKSELLEIIQYACTNDLVKYAIDEAFEEIMR